MNFHVICRPHYNAFQTKFPPDAIQWIAENNIQCPVCKLTHYGLAKRPSRKIICACNASMYFKQLRPLEVIMLTADTILEVK